MSTATSGARRHLARAIDPAVSRARTTDHAGGHLGCVQQGLRRQVRVSLRHPGRGVPEQPLHHVERDALIDEEAGERVAQVVEANVIETSAVPDAVPRAKNPGEAGREDIRA